ncbi:MFS transporter [Micromonospora costi]|uniref:MFS transporter n=1 Tax=Micromonospora costi TaxID=1530042 RepID=A0A3B0ACT6_9ACTN|nr:MFS transporter [Micromonospora costi]RKN58134.1 MFS transporter [Micromonospora costi]
MAPEVRTIVNLKPYRETLALPGLRSLLLVAVLARIPLTATGITMTLHVLDLGRGYAAAGLVGAAITVGAAIGGPVLGRLVDRRGLRPVLVLTGLVEAVYWSTAPSLPYPLLLPAAFVAGSLALPIFSVVRQSVAALVPEDRRRPAYALDSMSVELSFMVGPALAVALATAISARTTLYLVGAGIVAAGVAFWLLNPPTADAREETGTPRRRVSRREWMTPRLLAVLAVSLAATLVLGGTDVAVVAVLKESGEVGWTGAVLAMWAVASLVGGFAYGATRRPVPPLALMTALSLCTIPVGLGGSHWWLLCLAMIPAGALCAPTIAATADAVSRLAPAEVRGEAMGLHGSAVTVGIAVGAPLAGAVIDAHAPWWGFAVTGAIGVVVALAVLPIELRRRRAALPVAAEPEPEPAVTR